MAVKCGIAPAMKANIQGLFWGQEGEDFLKAGQERMCGHARKAKAHGEIMGIVEDLKVEEECTARDMMQRLTEQGTGSESMRTPVKIDKKPPEKQNVYSDGSAHTPRSLHWQIKGIGLYWPGRKYADEPPTQGRGSLFAP